MRVNPVLLTEQMVFSRLAASAAVKAGVTPRSDGSPGIYPSVAPPGVAGTHVAHNHESWAPIPTRNAALVGWTGTWRVTIWTQGFDRQKLATVMGAILDAMLGTGNSLTTFAFTSPTRAGETATYTVTDLGPIAAEADVTTAGQVWQRLDHRFGLTIQPA